MMFKCVWAATNPIESFSRRRLLQRRRTAGVGYLFGSTHLSHSSQASPDTTLRLNTMNPLKLLFFFFACACAQMSEMPSDVPSYAPTMKDMAMPSQVPTIAIEPTPAPTSAPTKAPVGSSASYAQFAGSLASVLFVFVNL